jgi:predicted pore-forming effector associated with SMODS systems
VHPYSTDATRPIRVMLILAVVAIGLAYLLNRSLSALHLKPPWWLDTPAVLGFYGLCWRLYDEYLWRLGPVTRTLSGVPNLAGQWTGTILSSYSDQEPVKATLVVRQTSSRLLLTLETDTSRSHSTMASLCSAPGPANGLYYAFTNVPRSLSKETMQPHTGTVQLTISADGSRLSGDYETNRFRATNGRLEFHRTAIKADGNEQPEGKPHAHT